VTELFIRKLVSVLVFFVFKIWLGMSLQPSHNPRHPDCFRQGSEEHSDDVSMFPAEFRSSDDVSMFPTEFRSSDDVSRRRCNGSIADGPRGYQSTYPVPKHVLETSRNRCSCPVQSTPVPPKKQLRIQCANRPVFYPLNNSRAADRKVEKIIGFSH
jgi:hypothetical protein